MVWEVFEKMAREGSGSLYRHPKLMTIFAVSLMGVMAVALISPAFPKIMDHFHVSKEEIGWLVTAFTLPGIFLVLFVGPLADRFGRKQVLTPCLILFGAAGAGCTLAPDFRTLLILRFLQGTGGSALIALSITLIGDYYDGVRRAEAMGANASVLSIGTASYPFIGGLLAEITWAAPFFLFLLAVPVGAGALIILENPRKRNFSIGPYLKEILSIASRPKTIAAMLASLLAFALLYGGVITYFVVLLEENFHASSTVIGTLTSAMSVVVAAVASQSGRLVERFSKGALIAAGFLGYGTGLILMPFIPTTWAFLIPVAVLGLGHGLCFPNLQTLVTELAPREYRAMTMSIYTSSTRIGMTLGPLTLALVLSFSSLEGVFVFGGLLALFTSTVGASVVYFKER